MNIQKITLNQQSHTINHSKPKAQNRLPLPSAVKMDSVNFRGKDDDSCSVGFVVGTGVVIGLAICAITAGSGTAVVLAGL